jgi:hypothetical protein
MPHDRMLCKGKALKRSAQFPTMKSVHSNAADLRQLSRHLVGVPMENGTPMTRGYLVSVLPHSNVG